MKVVKLTIRNFRCISTLDFLPSERNVLIGQVNAGKSTIVHALALLLDPDFGRRIPAVDETDFPGMKPTRTPENRPESAERPSGPVAEAEPANEVPVPMEIEATIGDLDDAQANHFLDYVELWDSKAKELIETADDARALDDPNNSRVVRMAFRAAYDQAEDAITYEWYYPKFAFDEQGLENRKCPRTDREMVGFFVIPAERDARRALSFSRYSVMDRALRADDIRLERQVAAIVEEIKGQGEGLFEKKEFATLVKEIEVNVDRLLRLNPDSERKLLFELTAMTHYDVMNSLRPFVRLAGTGDPYPVSAQGLGARQIIVLSALRMLAKRKRSSILAVEEPEIGLHPHMQRVLVGDLVRSASQVFITTHSVHVAEAASLKEVVCVVEGKNGIRYAKRADADCIPCLDKDIKRKIRSLVAHYPAEMADALFAPSVLLVEGIGDRESLPVLLRRLSQEPKSNLLDFDTLGAAVVPCDANTNVPDVASYYRSHLGRRVFALLDGNRSDTSDTELVQKECDCTFLWPVGQAIERVLLSHATASTLTGYIRLVTDEWSDDYFTGAGFNSALDLNQTREMVGRFVKHKCAHRSFAEYLPVNEISPAVRCLCGHLMRAVRGEVIGPLIRLADAAD
jgi:putative ATP-dependent endonuclease of the OLD family